MEFQTGGAQAALELRMETQERHRGEAQATVEQEAVAAAAHRAEAAPTTPINASQAQEASASTEVGDRMDYARLRYRVRLGVLIHPAAEPR